MKHLNKIASAFCAAALGMLALTSCEGGDLYKENSYVVSDFDKIFAEEWILETPITPRPEKFSGPNL